MVLSPQELADRTRALYRVLADFPDGYGPDGRGYLKPGAAIAFLDLRKLLETDILPALDRMARESE